MIDPKLQKHLEQMMYCHLRELHDGTIIGVQPMIFTTALCVGLDWESYSHRYCYEHTDDAVAAAKVWDGSGFPPGPWIKRKGLHPEILGPGATK